MSNTPDSKQDEALKPCPNIECRSVKVRRCSDFARHYVYCSDCLLRGPSEPIDNFGAKWNSLSRASVPAVEGDALKLAGELFEYFMGEHACGDFTCACGDCGLCEFRTEAQTRLSKLRAAASSPAPAEPPPCEGEQQ